MLIRIIFNTFCRDIKFTLNTIFGNYMFNKHYQFNILLFYKKTVFILRLLIMHNSKAHNETDVSYALSNLFLLLSQILSI